MRVMTAAFAVATALLVPLAPSADARATCRHLIADPLNDANPLGSPPGVDDNKLVDITAVDLKTDRKNVTAMLTVADIDPERVNFLRHSFAVWFGSQRKRYSLVASREPDGDSYWAWEVAAGQDYSEDETAGYAWAERGLGEVTGSWDAKANTIKIVAPLSLFTASGGLKKSLTEVHAISWTGVGAAGASTSGSDDFTDRVRGYTMGKQSCVR